MTVYLSKFSHLSGCGSVAASSSVTSMGGYRKSAIEGIAYEGYAVCHMQRLVAWYIPVHVAT